MVGRRHTVPGVGIKDGMMVNEIVSARDPILGTATASFSFTKANRWLHLENQAAAGGNALTFTVTRIDGVVVGPFTLAAGKDFDEPFDPFVALNITSTVPYYGYCRG